MRFSLYLMMILMAFCISRSAAAQGVDNFDLPGLDYRAFGAPTAAACRNSCGGDPRCQAWVWGKQGGGCWMKHRLPALVPNTCCRSGPRDHIEAADLTPEDNTDRPGMDYRSFDGGSWQDCETACRQDAACSSWTFRRQAEGANSACWLKNSVAAPNFNRKMISGVKFRRAAQIID